MYQNLHTYAEIQQQKLREASAFEALIHVPGPRTPRLGEQLRTRTGDALIQLGLRLKPQALGQPYPALRNR
ncbi:MAG: hypothetical protein DWG76_01240 [Chloroflexi bacterium]|nr:hypothetical protein [Chloroflexota bacterium]